MAGLSSAQGDLTMTQTNFGFTGAGDAESRLERSPSDFTSLRREDKVPVFGDTMNW